MWYFLGFCVSWSWNLDTLEHAPFHSEGIKGALLVTIIVYSQVPWSPNWVDWYAASLEKPARGISLWQKVGKSVSFRVSKYSVMSWGKSSLLDLENWGVPAWPSPYSEGGMKKEGLETFSIITLYMLSKWHW